MIHKFSLLLLLLILSHSQFTNPGCSNFSSSNLCLSCLNRYYLVSGICFPVNPLCLTYNPSNGNCLTCYSGFILSGSICITAPTILYCQNYSLDGTCTTCQDRFYLSSNTCTKVSDLCLTYSQDTGNCLSCNQGYILN